MPGRVEALGDVDGGDRAVDRGGQGRVADLRLQVVDLLLRLAPGVGGVVAADLGLADRRRCPRRSSSACRACFSCRRAAASEAWALTQLLLEVRGRGLREDVAALDGLADLGLDLGHRPGAGAGRRARVGREHRRRPEPEVVGLVGGDRARGGDAVGDVAGRRRGREVLGRVRGPGELEAAGRVGDRRAARGHEQDDDEQLQLHGRDGPLLQGLDVGMAGLRRPGPRSRGR